MCPETPIENGGFLGNYPGFLGNGFGRLETRANAVGATRGLRARSAIGGCAFQRFTRVSRKAEGFLGKPWFLGTLKPCPTSSQAGANASVMMAARSSDDRDARSEHTGEPRSLSDDGCSVVG